MTQQADFGTPPVVAEVASAPAPPVAEHPTLAHLREAYAALAKAVLAAGNLSPLIVNAIDAAKATVADAAKNIKEIV